MKTKGKLSSKQQEVLDKLKAGSTPAEVGNDLKISTNGVYGHMRRIEAKGHKVPRKGKGGKRGPKPKAAKAVKRTGTPVKAIDADIARISKQIEKRQAEIGREAIQIKGEVAKLGTRVDDLLTETNALAQRQVALAAAGA